MGHRRYLSVDHPWRQSKLHDGKTEMRTAPNELSRDDILEQLRCAEPEILGKSPISKDHKRKHSDS